jgi:hypothetical protein
LLKVIVTHSVSAQLQVFAHSKSDAIKASGRCGRYSLVKFNAAHAVVRQYCLARADASDAT